VPSINELRDRAEALVAEKNRAVKALQEVETNASKRGDDAAYTADEQSLADNAIASRNKADDELREIRSQIASETRAQARQIIDDGEDSIDDLAATRTASEVASLAGKTERGARKPLEYRGNPVPIEGALGYDSPEIRDAYLTMLVRGDARDFNRIREERNLQFDIDDKGGYLAPPQVMLDVIKKVDDILHIRQYATVYVGIPDSGIGIPSIEADPSDAEWTGEISSGTEDTSMEFGKRQLIPTASKKHIKVSNKLLRLPQAESIVLDRLAYKMALPQEKAFLTGDGANKPLGLFTASDSGIPASRDVSTGNTTTSIKFDGLIAAKYSCKSQHRRNGRWIFHRDGVEQIAKLKDGEGRYIWREAMSADALPTLLGHEVLESEHAPSTFTTGLVVGLFGDLSQYVIGQSLTAEITRNPFRYEEDDQTAFFTRAYLDAMPASVGGEAFSRVKLA